MRHSRVYIASSFATEDPARDVHEAALLRKVKGAFTYSWSSIELSGESGAHDHTSERNSQQAGSSESCVMKSAKE